MKYRSWREDVEDEVTEVDTHPAVNQNIEVADASREALETLGALSFQLMDAAETFLGTFAQMRQLAFAIRRRGDDA